MADNIEPKVDIVVPRRRPSIISIAIVSLVAGALIAKFLIWPGPDPCPPCPPPTPCPPCVTVLIMAPSGGPTVPVTMVKMETSGICAIDVQAPGGATVTLSGGPATDMLKIDGAPMPSPARVPPGAHTIAIETTAPGVRQIEITAEM